MNRGVEFFNQSGCWALLGDVCERGANWHVRKCLVNYG